MFPPMFVATMLTSVPFAPSKAASLTSLYTSIRIFPSIYGISSWNKPNSRSTSSAKPPLTLSCPPGHTSVVPSTNVTQTVPFGYHVLIHAKPSKRASWDIHSKNVSHIVLALHQYITFSLIANESKCQQFSHTVQFRESYLTQLFLTPEDRIIHTMSILTFTLKEAPDGIYNAQLDSVTIFHDHFGQWRGDL